MIQKCVNLDTATLLKVEEFAMQAAISRSSAIRVILNLYFGGRKNEERISKEARPNQETQSS